MKRGCMIMTVIVLIFALCFNTSTVSVKADDIESIYNTEDDTKITLVDNTENNVDDYDSENDSEETIVKNDDTEDGENDVNRCVDVDEDRSSNTINSDGLSDNIEVDTETETEPAENSEIVDDEPADDIEPADNEQAVSLMSSPLRSSPETVISVTVPTSISFKLDADGNVTCPESSIAQIINNGNTDIEITSTVLELNEGWSLEDWNTSFATLKVDQKVISMQLMNENVNPETGEFSISDFIVEAGSSLVITYDGKVAAQTEDINEVIGQLVFTVSSL